METQDEHESRTQAADEILRAADILPDQWRLREALGLSLPTRPSCRSVQLTIYNWEKGKTRPRKEQIAALVAVRGIGKREALRRLELLAEEG